VLGALALTVLVPASALASAGKSPAAGDGQPDGGGGSGPVVFSCAENGAGGPGQPGIWGGLGSKRHDDLVLVTQAGTLEPGSTFTVVFQWEWRDWRPGAPLALRLCVDADGPDARDGEATGPVEDLGASPIDRSSSQPDREPALRVLTDSGEVRPVVRVPVTVTVPDAAPPGGEICVRGAVTGAEEDHRTSPPLFDISRTLCRPLAQVMPVASPTPSPSPAPSPSVPSPTVPAPVPPAPPASPSPSPAVPRVMRRAPRPAMPATGIRVIPELALGALLVGGGVTLTRMHKRRSTLLPSGSSGTSRPSRPSGPSGGADAGGPPSSQD
jgi:hypothetical protein